MGGRTPAELLKRIAIWAAALAFVVLLLWRFSIGWTPSRDDYPTQGIDVSHHQGEIDWKAAHADGVDFAYIKASEGTDMRDPQFEKNWAESKAAGVRRGAYHYFDLCRLARDQATNFITVVPRERAALPPAVDLEFGGNCASRPSRTVFLDELATFVRMVEAHSEKPVMLYLTPEFEEEYQVSAVIDRPLWLRRVAFPPDFGAHPWVMWQANPRKRVAGISGSVDWDVVRK
jgi:lysozyme